MKAALIFFTTLVGVIGSSLLTFGVMAEHPIGLIGIVFVFVSFAGACSFVEA